MKPQETSGSSDNKLNFSEGSIEQQYHEMQEKITEAKDAIRMLENKIHELERKVNTLLVREKIKEHGDSPE